MLGLLVGMTSAAVNLGRRRVGDVRALKIGVASGAGKRCMDRAAEALAIDIDRYGLLAMLGCHALVAVTSQACVVISFRAGRRSRQQNQDKKKGRVGHGSWPQTLVDRLADDSPLIHPMAPCVVICRLATPYPWDKRPDRIPQNKNARPESPA